MGFIHLDDGDLDAKERGEGLLGSTVPLLIDFLEEASIGYSVQTDHSEVLPSE